MLGGGGGGGAAEGGGGAAVKVLLTADKVRADLILHIFIKSFCKSQLLHKYVNFSLILVMRKDELTDFCAGIDLCKTT